MTRTSQGCPTMWGSGTQLKGSTVLMKPSSLITVVVLAGAFATPGLAQIAGWIDQVYVDYVTQAPCGAIATGCARARYLAYWLGFASNLVLQPLEQK